MSSIDFLSSDLFYAIFRELHNPSVVMQTCFNADLLLVNPIGLGDDVIKYMFPILVTHETVDYVESFKLTGKMREVILYGPYQGYDLVAWCTFPNAKRNLSRLSKWWRKKQGIPEEFYGVQHFYFKLERAF
jgi:hypothetical protein